jgi:hypothetical protein
MQNAPNHKRLWPLSLLQRADPRKRHTEKPNNLLNTHSIFRWLDLLNKRTANYLNKRIYSHEASEAGSIVCTIAAGIVRTII